MKTKWRYPKKTFYMLLLVFPIAFLAKVYQYNFTGGLNFGIMNYIRIGILKNELIGMKSYDFPIKVYSIFKFLGMQTNLQWSIFVTTIFTVIMFLMLLRYKTYSTKEYIFIFFSMFILCWTVMNLNKDSIQLMFMLIIYKVCSSNMTNKKKIVISAMIFFVESLCFREYYILVAGLTLLIYFVINKKLQNNDGKYLKDVFIIFGLFFIGIFLCQFVSKDSYNELVNRRDSLENIENVRTIIKDKISGSNFGIFMINYIINFFRIIFPIELIKFGAKYMIFFVYQLMSTGAIIKSLKKIKQEKLVFFVIVLAYTIMLVASESDFGTLARHQSVLMMFYITLLREDKKEELEIENEQKS